MTDSTHAVLAVFDTDLERESEQKIGLAQFIVPSVKAAPGFVSGHWTLDREAAESIAFITFDSERSARDLVENVRGNADNQRDSGLALRSIRVVEVSASASV